MVYGYSRVSTEGQRDNNSREAQETMLKSAGAEKIFHDVMSGAKTNRPELQKLLGEIKSGDKLIVCKLDRLSRTATDGFELVQSLMEKGVIVQILNLGTLDNTPTGKLILHVFLAFAEFERDSIRDRMAEGKAIARTRPGYHEGRKKQYTEKQLNHAMELLKDHSYTQVSEMLKISKSTLAREVRKRRAKEQT